MNKRISPTMYIGAGKGPARLCCSACGHDVGAAGQPWKDKVPLKATPVSGLQGWPGAVHPGLLLREFSCPACGQLLDSEVALPEDPYLDDIVAVEGGAA